MFQALHVRDFRLLWCGWTISLTGSWLLVVAVPAYVFTLTGSYTATGLTLAAQFIPPLLLGPFAGVLVDRLDRRTVMIAADLLRASSVALLLLVHAPSQVWVIYLSLAAESAATVAFRPAARSHVPDLVGTGPALSSANALTGASDGAVRLIAAPLGAALLAVAGLELLVWLDIGTYLIAVLTAWLIATHHRADQTRRHNGIRGVLHDLHAGVQLLIRDPTIRTLATVNTIFLTANAVLSSILVPFGVTILGSPTATGLLVSALGIGYLVATPLIRALTDIMAPAFLLGASLLATGAGFVLLFSTRSLATALPSAVLIGLAGSTTLAVVQTTLQRNCTNDMLGRTSAALLTGEAAATLTGALLGPFLAEITSLPTSAFLAGALAALTGLGATLLLPRTPPHPAAAENTDHD